MHVAIEWHKYRKSQALATLGLAKQMGKLDMAYRSANMVESPRHKLPAVLGVDQKRKGLIFDAIHKVTRIRVRERWARSPSDLDPRKGQSRGPTALERARRPPWVGGSEF